MDRHTLALGLAFAERRHERRLSQEAVALASGLHRKTIYQLENGIHAARFSTLVAVTDDLADLAAVMRRASEIAADLHTLPHARSQPS